MLIFAKRIRSKYFQNSLVIAMKYAKRNCLCYFGVNVSQSNIVSSVFFYDRGFCNYCRHSQRRSNSLLFCSFLFLIIGQDILSHLALLCIERAYVNRVDFQLILDQKTLVIYIGTCKKSELVTSMLAKWNLSLSY